MSKILENSYGHLTRVFTTDCDGENISMEGDIQEQTSRPIQAWLEHLLSSVLGRINI
jgi:hypothetical protein